MSSPFCFDLHHFYQNKYTLYDTGREKERETNKGDRERYKWAFFKSTLRNYHIHAFFKHLCVSSSDFCGQVPKVLLTYFLPWGRFPNTDAMHVGETLAFYPMVLSLFNDIGQSRSIRFALHEWASVSLYKLVSLHRTASLHLNVQPGCKILTWGIPNT